MGRPTSLTQTVADTIIAALQEGCSLRAACRIARVSPNQAELWMHQARDGATGLRATFLFGVEAARGADEAKLVARMRHFALTCNGDQAAVGVKATAFLLERLYPDTWRLRTGVEVTGPDGGPVEVAVIRCVIPQAGEAEEPAAEAA